MKEIKNITEFKNVFFIGIAGVGMSAIAQYLKGIDKHVSGSDRYFKNDEINETRDKLEAVGISCFVQNGDGINDKTDLVVVSTAIEDSVPEVLKAKSLNIPILKRSELLALIAESKKTIAVGGTSGKSTTAAMIFEILDDAGMQPSIITGAGLTRLIKTGKLGNAFVGNGDWLIIEADESDGSIVQYKPEIGLLLNVDKDHQELEELMDIFSKFKENTKSTFIVNNNNSFARQLSANSKNDFGYSYDLGFTASDFVQHSFEIKFKINNHPFSMKAIGEHSMENALAATAVAVNTGVDLQTCSNALAKYEGIYRRHQILGQKNGISLIDDYAHNPAKCKASIAACRPISSKIIAWFQPHGYAPTRFLKDDFIAEISEALRPEDEIWMSEIFYAGGTTTKDISASDLIDGINKNGKNAFFVADRNDFLSKARSHFNSDTVLLLMGARDPSLEAFANKIWEEL